MLRLPYFASCFLCLWKTMLPHLKSLWEIILNITQKTVSTTIDHTTIKKLYSAVRIWKKLFHILFKKRRVVVRGRGIKQSYTVEVIRKLESYNKHVERILKDLKSTTWYGMSFNILSLVFKYFLFFFILHFPLSIAYFEKKIKNVNPLPFFNSFLLCWMWYSSIIQNILKQNITWEHMCNIIFLLLQISLKTLLICSF